MALLELVRSVALEAGSGLRAREAARALAEARLDLGVVERVPGPPSARGNAPGVLAHGSNGRDDRPAFIESRIVPRP